MTHTILLKPGLPVDVTPDARMRIFQYTAFEGLEPEKMEAAAVRPQIWLPHPQRLRVLLPQNVHLESLDPLLPQSQPEVTS